MSLNGKIALVTGAATGIGASLAKALALEGALVVGADLAWGDSEQAPGVERCVADIETRHGPVDMGRRGLHDEGSEILRERLKGKIEVDSDTARRLFTLLCVLHLKG